MLRHLVEKSLQGAGAELKEYTLGVEVFDRGSNFDPRLDPIVRVEASRLRSRLRKYYEEDGVASEIRIELPRGAYLPSFVPLRKAAALPEPAVSSVLAEPTQLSSNPVPLRLPRRNFWLAIVLIAGVVALGAVVWLRLSLRNQAPSPRFVRFIRITNEPVRCTFPAFSPDGRYLAYARQENNRWKLYQKRLDNLDTKAVITASDSDDYQPAYPPAGKLLAFRSDRDGGGIFLANTVSGTVSRLSSLGFYPSWSPDAAALVFSTETFIDPAETSATKLSMLQVVDLKTRKIRSITDSSTDALQPAWSPHGNRIAFWALITAGTVTFGRLESTRRGKSRRVQFQ